MTKKEAIKIFGRRKFVLFGTMKLKNGISP